MVLEFLAASLLIELTPGPNMAWLALLGASRGRLAALAAVAGVALGLSVAGTAAALGVSTLIGTTPWLFQGSALGRIALSALPRLGFLA